MTQTAPIQTAKPSPRMTAASAKSEKQVVEGKKPGLKPGQKICARPKLKSVQIDAIARAIVEHSLDNPAKPISYTALEERFGFTAVTLRSKPSIRAAMETARVTAAQSVAEAKKNDTADVDDPAENPEATIRRLRDEIRQQTLEVENYRRDHQLLTLYFHMRGETLSQVLTQAGLHMSGTPIPSGPDGKSGPTHRVNPISRQ